jgi:hypothetical protein
VLFGCLLLEFPFIVVEAVSVSLIDIEVVVSMIALLVALMILVEVVVLVCMIVVVVVLIQRNPFWYPVVESFL